MTVHTKTLNDEAISEKQKHQFIDTIKEFFKKENGRTPNCKFDFSSVQENKIELIISGPNEWHVLSTLTIFLDRKVESRSDSTTAIILNLEDFNQLKRAVHTKVVTPPRLAVHRTNPKSTYKKSIAKLYNYANNPHIPVILSTAAITTITITFSILSILAHCGCIAAAVTIAPYSLAGVAAIGVAALLGFFIHYTVTKALQTYHAKTTQPKNNSLIARFYKRQGDDGEGSVSLELPVQP